jgi:hypothetical protein
MAEPIRLTVLAISGIATIASLATADMAIHQQDRDHVSVKRDDRAESQKQISEPQWQTVRSIMILRAIKGKLKPYSLGPLNELNQQIAVEVVTRN